MLYYNRNYCIHLVKILTLEFDQISYCTFCLIPTGMAIGQLVVMKNKIKVF